MNFNKDIIKYISNFSGYGKTAVEYFMNNNKYDKQILDPLTTVIKNSIIIFLRQRYKTKYL